MRLGFVSRSTWFCAFAFASWAACAQAEDGDAGEEDKENATKPYVRPEVGDGIHWVETFDGEVWSRWKSSGAEKFNGKFTVEKRKKEALVGDVGLLVPEEAKHYGAATVFPAIEGKKDVPFVVQFEVRFQDGLSCGGSYIKLFDSEGKEAGEFKDDTPYVIMFGPDRCGGTDKVHFILKHKSPKTGAWEEKHCKDPPHVPSDQMSHLYGLVIHPDNNFEILIDGEKKTSGNLLTSMQPPINPPKEIDDPADKKPEDWIDDPQMDDPESSKPDDWDEDAPMMIVDETVTMPSGWVEDAPKQIADPEAKRPEDWDDEEDGDWEAPIIANPVCKVGCGKWEPPKIKNPEYKGKWNAPRIDNPEYKGVWKARQIENPDYFNDESPCILPKIDSVGIDIWTMSKGMIFDNILIATDPAQASAFGDQSWKLRKEIEETQNPKPAEGLASRFLDWYQKNMIAVSATALIVLVATILYCSGMCSKKKEPSRNRSNQTAERRSASEREGESKAEGEQTGEASEDKADAKKDEDKKDD